ncbi:class I SAM-dependent methyltransferase [Rhodanobacter glycinis]|uniref:class I SAM-dependent methyltransferase n=1 Tax=Rhodanobacter glycinis TaxID=582702 RepID=UPI0011263CD6|nr:class I SAM-dependent methyltransferase [Rhodanobacter glycinis]TPG47842.1 class I SAM-dependent methyltransferase [Rhodanobacter glycinis]
MNDNSDITCPYCAAHELRLLGKLPDSRWFAGKHLEKQLPGGALYRCCSCRLKFRYPLHDADVYRRLYDNTAVSTWPVDAIRQDWELIIDYILQRLPLCGRILDFGCYTGGLLARLSPSYERHGVEINKAAAAFATDKQLAQIWSSLDDIPGELRFDIIIASDVIEHMPNPGCLIDKLFTQLAAGGALIITTGDADNYLWNRFHANWWYCFYPEHISFLSRDWLGHFSNARGLSIEHCDKFRYCHLSIWHRCLATALTYIYGYFPSAYLYLRNMLRSMLSRPDVTSVPGNGVSADHLFIVLVRNGKYP